MGLAEQMRQDFKNLFIADMGEPFDVKRNGQVSHVVKALVGNRKLQLCLDTDVKEGDILKGQLSNKDFTITKIEYEVVEQERVTMIAYCK